MKIETLVENLKNCIIDRHLYINKAAELQNKINYKTNFVQSKEYQMHHYFSTRKFEYDDKIFNLEKKLADAGMPREKICELHNQFVDLAEFVVKGVI